MRFLHKCGNAVSICQMISFISLTNSFSYDGQNICFGIKDLFEKENFPYLDFKLENSKPIFFCPSCRTQVGLNEISGECQFCGKIVPIDHFYISKIYSGICEEDLESIKNFLDKGVPLPHRLKVLIDLFSTSRIKDDLPTKTVLELFNEKENLINE